MLVINTHLFENLIITKEDVLKCSHGLSSYFYIVSDVLGIKFFKSKLERNRSRQKQEIAYHSGLAPKPGSIYDIPGFFGYYTERVVMIHDLYTYKTIPSKIYRQMQILEQELLTCCDFEIDVNWQNYGVINGQLVCIDFGD